MATRKPRSVPASRTARRPAVEMEPGVRPGTPPPLHKMPEDSFEELCRDVFAREGTVESCRRYGTRGNKQRGIDLLAFAKNSQKLEVAQCKCYESFPKGLIADASDAFMKHLAYWQEKKVRRFVLIVAEPLEHPGQQEQIIVERRRFEAVGIRYQAWSLHDLLRHLRPWPDIVIRYIDQDRGYWVEKICGPGAALAGNAHRRRRTEVRNSSADRQFRELIELAAEGVGSKLEALRAMARRGLIGEASAKLAVLQGESAVWNDLPPALRAKTLRLRASLALDEPEGTAEAKRLGAEADSIDRVPSMRLEASIVLVEQGPEACLELIDDADEADADLTRLAAVCELRLGRPEAAETRLRLHSASDSDAETNRLLGLAAAMSGQTAEAVALCRHAATLEPDTRAIQVTLGIVLYLSGLAPIAVRDGITAWPEPCDWRVVKRDETSVLALREAAELFRTLRMGGRGRPENREHLRAWRLACLCNDAERQDEAQAYCREILKEEPTYPPAINWALARALPIEGEGSVLDPARTRRALEDLLDAGRGDLTHLTTLATLVAWGGRPDKVERLFAKHDRLFADADAIEYRQALLAEAALRKGEVPVDHGANVDSIRAEMLAAINDADEEAAAGKLVAVTKRCLERASPHPAFAEALFRLAYMQRLTDVAPFADDLLALVGTADTAMLAAEAKAAAGDNERAIAIVDAAAPLFPGNALPRRLRQLRVQCNLLLGKLPAAIAEMQELQEDAVDVAESIGLADLYLRRGDLESASRAISSVASDPRLAPEHALRYARLLGKDRPELGRLLWRSAVASPMDDALLPAAFDVARNLSIGAEAAFIARRLAASAVPIDTRTDAATTVSLSIDQLAEFLAERRVEMERLYSIYANGGGMLHLLAPAMGLSFARLFHGHLQRRERGEPIGNFLPAAYGGRPPASEFPEDPSSWRLHLDISAVLMGAHLSILDVVERCFRPLRISSHLVPALLLMRTEILDGSPDEDDAASEILEGLKTGRLSSVDNVPDDGAERRLAQLAGGENGVAVMWGDGAARCRSEGLSATNLSGLVAMLAEQGLLTPEREAEVRRDLGVAGEEAPMAIDLARGRPLFFHANTVLELARAGLLDETCKAFRVGIEAPFVEHMQGIRSDRVERAELGSWLGDLLGRLNNGIQDGTYVLLAIGRPPDERFGRNAELVHGLLDLLQISPQSGDVVWVDDRTLQAYPAFGSSQLVGICDILGALHRYRRLDDAEYFDRLLRLKAAEVIFLQPIKGELIFWLRRAEYADGRVIETVQLRTIRKYLAACLSREGNLQLPPMPSGSPNPGGEVSFVSSWRSQVMTVLTELWTDLEMPPGKVLACSRWLMDSIWVERYGRFPAMAASEEGRRGLLASGLASLLGVSQLLGRPFVDDTSRAPNFLNWLWAEFIQSRLPADPVLEMALVEALKAMFRSAPEQELATNADRLQRMLDLRLLELLPSRLAARLLADGTFVTRLGLGSDLRVVPFGDRSLPAVAYMNAAIGALDGTAQRLRANDGAEVEITASATSGAVVVEMRGGGLHEIVSDPLNRLLLGDDDSQRTALASDGRWADLPPARLSAELDRIMSLRDRPQRIFACIDLRGTSAVAAYDAMEHRLSQGHELSFEELSPPSASALLNHLRLDPNRGAPMSARLTEAARSLLDQLGLEEAFLRTCGLPLQVPAPIVEAFSTLTFEDQTAFLDRWFEAPVCPMHMLSAASLAVHSQGWGNPGAEVPGRVRAIGAAAAAAEFEAFSTLLEAVGATSAEWDRSADLDTAERIVACWAHASRIYRLIRPFVRDATDVEVFASPRTPDSMGAVFSDNLAYRADAACPQIVTGLEALAYGLFQALGPEPASPILNELRPILSGSMYMSEHEPPLPSPWLLQDRQQRLNLIGSYLVADIAPLIDKITGTDLGKWSRSEILVEAVRASLGGPGSEPPGAIQWRMVLPIVGFAPIPAAMVDLLTAASAAPLPDGADIGFHSMVLRFVCMQAAFKPSTDLPDAAKRFFRRLAPDILSHAVDAEDERLLQSIMRTAIDLTRSPDGNADIQAFAAVVSALVAQVPSAAEGIRRFVTAACYRLPHRSGGELWPLLLSLRAI